MNLNTNLEGISNIDTSVDNIGCVCKLLAVVEAVAIDLHIVLENFHRDWGQIGGLLFAVPTPDLETSTLTCHQNNL